VAVAPALEAPVALRLLEHLAALLARVDGSLDARHLLQPQHLLHGVHVRLGDELRLTEAALPLRGLVLQVVAPHPVPPEQLAAPRHLEPLLRCAACLRLRHLVSLPRSSSGPAASPCSVRRGAAATRPGRSPSRPPPAASGGRARAPDGSSRDRGT